MRQIVMMMVAIAATAAPVSARRDDAAGVAELLRKIEPIAPKPFADLLAKLRACEAARGVDQCIAGRVAASGQFLQMNEPQAAERVAWDAVTRADRALAEGDLIRAMAYRAWGDAFNAMGQYQKAEEAYRRAIALRQTTAGQDDRALQQFYLRLAPVLSAHDRVAEAERITRGAIASYEKSQAESRLIGAAHLVLAQLLLKQRRFALAGDAFAKAVPLSLAGMTPDDPQRPGLLLTIAGFQIEAGDLAGAESTLQDALRQQRDQPSGRQPRLAETYRRLAIVLERQGKYAKGYYGEALKLRFQLPASHPRRLQSTMDLARHMNAIGDPPEAVRTLTLMAEAGIRARIVERSGFHASAQQEARYYRPIYRAHVRAAWRLAWPGS